MCRPRAGDARPSALDGPSFDDMPAHHLCALSLLPMAEPVRASDGFTYDREAVEFWLTNHSCSPMTGEWVPFAARRAACVSVG